MQNIEIANGITLSYEDIGKRKAPTIIMIMGLGAQMTVWPDELYYGLANKGYRVIRFDNRDVGLSSHLDDLGTVNPLKVWLAKRTPLKAHLPYSLDDMANDVIELMAALKVKKAHLVGASMGGMIAQLISAKHPKKVRSLTSIMSSSSGTKLTPKNINLLLKLAKLQRTSTTRQGAILYNIKLNQLIGSPHYPQHEDLLRKQAIKHIDRAHNPSGFKRQLAAITASASRDNLLSQIKTPTLVIHGEADIIMPLAVGEKTAAQIRRSKLKVVPGMGHNFPPDLMEKMTKWIAKHVKKAELKHLKKKDKKRIKTPSPHL
jgi:pimeloyl-ACP methyl ester carboxylesterase